jgi:hypothetical protein
MNKIPSIFPASKEIWTPETSSLVTLSSSGESSELPPRSAPHGELRLGYRLVNHPSKRLPSTGIISRETQAEHDIDWHSAALQETDDQPSACHNRIFCEDRFRPLECLVDRRFRRHPLLHDVEHRDAKHKTTSSSRPILIRASANAVGG